MLDMSNGAMLSGLILGAIGFVMFMYGKRNEEPLVLLGGIALSLLPMFLHALLPLWGISGALIAAVYFLRHTTGTQPLA